MTHDNILQYYARGTPYQWYRMSSWLYCIYRYIVDRRDFTIKNSSSFARIYYIFLFTTTNC